MESSNWLTSPVQYYQTGQNAHISMLPAEILVRILMIVVLDNATVNWVIRVLVL